MREREPGWPFLDGRSGRVALVGDWAGPYVSALSSAFTMVDSAPSGHPIDWLLGTARSGRPASLRAWAHRLRASSSPELRVAVVDPDHRWPASDGWDVYVAGDIEPSELIAALWLASKGFSINRPTEPAKHRFGSPSVLTDRETELMQALCTGLGNDQIARELHISRSTVEFHLTRIFKKLEVSSRAEAIVAVLQPEHRLTASGVS
ncbi:MAG: response regulator transcription factor [Sporichthyaceae bacterium]|nr:response regulator transcription factor [Sporichthyaceae bacterium]